MKQILLLLLALTSGCSLRAADVPSAPPSAPESLPSSMAMIGRYGLAHACPVDGLLITAAHVAASTGFDGVEQMRGYVYSQGPRNGYLGGYAPLVSRDLAQLMLNEGDAPLMATRAEAGPSQGDRIYWNEFNVTNAPMRPETQHGRVTEVGPGHFAFRPEPAAGASGGCVFTEDGKVLGVIIWGLGRGPTISGVAASLTGQWWPGE